MTKELPRDIECALIQAAGALTRTYHRNKAMTAAEKDIEGLENDLNIPDQELGRRVSEARNRHNTLESILESYGEVLEGLRAKFKDGTFSIE
ncbi:hypothetical protein predicted by Glimmer/Critica [Acetobacter senegalensis]|uniref:Uncharacterized protein n=1 Tax=Acetobacter senegalensis TaxID=446692 RepID=A0A0U5EYV0_9PROT|nr:hypothetical protein [Acetobacter senegalensis]CEF41265.1 hypothetical protein predicted by Glimmer/Critica [Acetobacter senegalensis]